MHQKGCFRALYFKPPPNIRSPLSPLIWRLNKRPPSAKPKILKIFTSKTPKNYIFPHKKWKMQNKNFKLKLPMFRKPIFLGPISLSKTPPRRDSAGEIFLTFFRVHGQNGKLRRGGVQTPPPTFPGGEGGVGPKIPRTKLGT